MDEVFQKTRELGEAIQKSEAYQTMKALEDVVTRNNEAANTMGDYVEKKQLIESMLTHENPDVEALKALSDELDILKEKLNLIDDVKALTEARTRFSDLIEEVNTVLRFIVTGEMGSDSDGCSGNCDRCGGCGELH